MPRPVLELASTQHALLSRDDLRRAGISPRQLQRLATSGALDRLGTNVFRTGGAPSTERQRLLAGCLDTGGALTCRSGTRYHEIGRLPAMARPEVVVKRRGRGDVRPLAIVHTTTWLPDDDVIRIDGIPGTTVARTLFSLAALVPEVPASLVRDLIDEAIRDRKAKEAWLWWRLEQLRCRGRNGVQVFEDILSTRRAGEVTESWLERQFLEVIRRAGMPVPRCQERIDHRGAFVARVDFLYPEARVVVEVSGHRTHHTPEQQSRDARRRTELGLAGYLVLEFSYDQVVRDPAFVVARVREALRLERVA